MKIQGPIQQVGGPPAGDPKPRPAPSKPQQSAPGEVRVELSALSSSLNKAEAAIAATPAVDRARVDEIRQAISEGRFKVDAERIADGLIDSVRQMLATQSGRP